MGEQNIVESLSNESIRYLLQVAVEKANKLDMAMRVCTPRGSRGPVYYEKPPSQSKKLLDDLTCIVQILEEADMLIRKLRGL